MAELVFRAFLFYTAPVLVRIDNSADLGGGMEFDFPIGQGLVACFTDAAMPHLAAQIESEVVFRVLFDLVAGVALQFIGLEWHGVFLADFEKWGSSLSTVATTSCVLKA